MGLLTDIGVLGIIHTIYQYTKVNNNYMKLYNRNKESSYLKVWDVNNLCLGNVAKASRI